MIRTFNYFDPNQPGGLQGANFIAQQYIQILPAHVISGQNKQYRSTAFDQLTHFHPDELLSACAILLFELDPTQKMILQRVDQTAIIHSTCNQIPPCARTKDRIGPKQSSQMNPQKAEH